MSETIVNTVLPKWPAVPICDATRPDVSAWNAREHPDEQKQYIEIADVDASTKAIARTRTVEGRSAPSRARNVVRAGDVLVSTTRPNLNAVALVPQALDGQVCSTGFAVLRPNDRVTSTWLYWFVRSPGFVREISSMVDGAMYPAVTDNEVRSVSISLPSVPEQKRIAAKLDEQTATLTSAQAALAAQREAATALRSAVLRAALDPAAHPNWNDARLGGLVEFVRGVSFKPSEAASSSFAESTPILRAGNIGDRLDLDQDLIFVPSSRVSEKQRLRRGDLVICMSSGSAQVVGKTAPLESDWAGSVGAFCGIIRPSAQVLGMWLRLIFRSDVFRDWRDSQARGANIQNLRFSEMANITIPLPSLMQQRNISEQVNGSMRHIDAIVTSLDDQAATLDSLRTSLLDAAFSGQI